jgi:hypothetical protein
MGMYIDFEIEESIADTRVVIQNIVRYAWLVFAKDWFESHR